VDPYSPAGMKGARGPERLADLKIGAVALLEMGQLTRRYLECEVGEAEARI